MDMTVSVGFKVVRIPGLFEIDAGVGSYMGAVLRYGSSAGW